MNSTSVKVLYGVHRRFYPLVVHLWKHYMHPLHAGGCIGLLVVIHNLWTWSSNPLTRAVHWRSGFTLLKHAVLFYSVGRLPFFPVLERPVTLLETIPVESTVQLGRSPGRVISFFCKLSLSKRAWFILFCVPFVFAVAAASDYPTIQRHRPVLLQFSKNKMENLLWFARRHWENTHFLFVMPRIKIFARTV